jgi:uncharacterized membrane protein
MADVRTGVAAVELLFALMLAAGILAAGRERRRAVTLETVRSLVSILSRHYFARIASLL